MGQEDIAHAKVGQQVAQDKQADGELDLVKAPKRGSGPSALARGEERLGYLLLMPTFIILLIIAIYPLGSVVYYSFTNRAFASSQPTEFVGLDNYANLLGMTVRGLPRVQDPDTGEMVLERPINVLRTENGPRYREVGQFGILGNQYVVGATDPDFIDGAKSTLIFAVLSVIFETVLGIGVALVVNSQFPGRGLMRVVMLIPWAIPTAVSSRMWEFMFDPTRRGFFNVLTQGLGLTNGQTAWLTEASYQLPAMIAIDVWKTTPFMALLVLAGLQLIPQDIYEAADVDGASKLRQFFNITLPLLRPTLAVALIFRTLDALRVFDVFQIVLQEKRYSMASFTYFELIKNRQMGYSAASSVVIFLIIFVFAILYMRTLGVQEE